VVRALGPAAKDPAAVLKASGVASERKLRDLAAGKGGREDLAPLHALAEKIAGMDEKKVTVWCRGRNLASMLVAAHVQAKAGSK
jgi:hypothetical protein